MNEIICYECSGEGHFTAVSGGRYNASAEQWYPNEVEVECVACSGSGWLEASEDEPEWVERWAA